MSARIWRKPSTRSVTDRGVVGDVAQGALELLVGVVLLEPGRQPVQHPQQRPGRPLELDDLARQLVDAPRHLRVPAEDLSLDLVDVLLQPGDDRGVAVDDAVEDRVQHGLWAKAQELGVVLHPASHDGQVRSLAVPDGQHEVRADEDVDLAELDLLDVIEVTRGAQDDEQRVAVALQLRTLVGDDRVLDRDLVQPELLADRQELRLCRPEQPDPGHRALLPAQTRSDLGHRCRALDPSAVPVDRRVDDALLDGLGDGRRTRLHRDLGRGLPTRVDPGSGRAPGRKMEAGTPVGHHVSAGGSR